MPIPENRSTWPHADPVAAADHIADHNALAAAANVFATHTHAVPTGGVIRKTANQTMTATAQTAVTDMSFPVVSGGKYYFVMSVRVTTSTGTAPTTAWGFTGPAGTVAINAEQDTSTSVEQKGLLTAFGALAAGAQVANTGAGFRGVVEPTASGTVQLTVARGGTTPSMVIPAGCTGFWVRLA